MTIQCLLAVTLALVACMGTEARASDISQLAWLSGCWKSEASERGSGEQWLPLAGDTLLGVNRTVKQGKTVAFELMQIRAMENGKLASSPCHRGSNTRSFFWFALVEPRSCSTIRNTTSHSGSSMSVETKRDSLVGSRAGKEIHNGSLNFL